MLRGDAEDDVLQVRVCGVSGVHAPQALSDSNLLTNVALRTRIVIIVDLIVIMRTVIVITRTLIVIMRTVIVIIRTVIVI